MVFGRGYEFTIGERPYLPFSIGATFKNSRAPAPSRASCRTSLTKKKPGWLHNIVTNTQNQSNFSKQILKGVIC